MRYCCKNTFFILILQSKLIIYTQDPTLILPCSDVVVHTNTVHMVVLTMFRHSHLDNA